MKKLAVIFWFSLASAAGAEPPAQTATSGAASSLSDLTQQANADLNRQTDMQQKLSNAGKSLQTYGEVDIGVGAALVATGAGLMMVPGSEGYGALMMTGGIAVGAFGVVMANDGNKLVAQGDAYLDTATPSAQVPTDFAAAVQSALASNPQATQALGQLGIDPGTVANIAAGGGSPTPQDIGNALGISVPSTIDPGTVAAAQQAVQQAVQNAGGSLGDSPFSPFGSSATASGGSTAPNGAIGSGAGSDGSFFSNLGGSGGSGSLLSDGGPIGTKKSGSATDENGDGSGGAGGGGKGSGIDSLLADLFAGRKDPEKAAKLESLGVSLNRARQNIFQIASRHHHNFGKYRAAARRRPMRSVASVLEQRRAIAAKVTAVAKPKQ